MSSPYSAEQSKSIQNEFSRVFPRVHFAYNFYCDTYEETPTIYIVDSRSGDEFIVTINSSYNVFDKRQTRLKLMQLAINQKANNSLQLVTNA